MPFIRPSLAELIDRASADIEAGLPGTDARLRRSNLAVLARVHSGAVHGLYGYLQYLANQLMPDMAEAAFLDRHAGVWGVFRLAAAFASGTVTVSGTTGAVVPAGTQLLRGDGVAYAATADAVLVDETAALQVAAIEAGAAGDAVAGTQVAFVQPVAGVASACVVASGGLAGGSDRETDAGLRTRLLQRMRQPAMGGAAHDYVSWALAVPGVTRAWCYPLELGAGTVVVRFVRDDDASPIPGVEEVQDVQDHIDGLRPVTAQCTVLAPVSVPLNMTIALTPSTVAVRAAVEAELLDLLRREAMPGGTMLLSHLREAISVAAGETNHVLVTPTADVVHSAGQMAVLGAITWS